ncbi:hypothetical protein DFH08DRAFT_821358 [Mycena albidolilacea]|uniref:Kinesin light chain n=1 Tax=Mycena albidolilacea TaxID=1033008 RepID=A0AAD6ZA35_9AGAR|nr:hypothetical protein DFH08DRAFT_821358 [Mycena albidolilacea]
MSIVHCHVAMKLCGKMTNVLKDIGIDILTLGPLDELESPLDYDGVDLLATMILSGIPTWFGKLNRRYWSVQTWYSGFREFLVTEDGEVNISVDSFHSKTSDQNNMLSNTQMVIWLVKPWGFQSRRYCLLVLFWKCFWSSETRRKLNSWTSRGSSVTIIQTAGRQQKLLHESITNLLGKVQMAEGFETVKLVKRGKATGKSYLGALPTMVDLATTYCQQGLLKKAEELFIVVLEKQRVLLGEDHPETLQTMSNLASTYGQNGLSRKAREIYIELLAKHRELLSDDHPDTLRTMAGLASTYEDLRLLKVVEMLNMTMLEKRRQLLGGDHPESLCHLRHFVSLANFEKVHHPL